MENKKRLIDANALENLIRTNAKVEANDAQYDIGRAHGLINAADLIHNAPTIDAVEVVYAKAVSIRSDIDYDDTLIRMDRQCNRCGALIIQTDNYCPNCGAKMDGDRNA